MNYLAESVAMSPAPWGDCKLAGLAEYVHTQKVNSGAGRLGPNNVIVKLSTHCWQVDLKALVSETQIACLPVLPEN